MLAVGEHFFSVSQLRDAQLFADVWLEAGTQFDTLGIAEVNRQDAPLLFDCFDDTSHLVLNCKNSTQFEEHQVIVITNKEVEWFHIHGGENGYFSQTEIPQTTVIFKLLE